MECYSKNNRPHPVPPQEAVDASWEDVFERNDLNKRLRNVLLCVDGLSSTRSDLMCLGTRKQYRTQTS